MILNGGKSMRSFRIVAVCGSSFATSFDKGTAWGGGPPRSPPPCACAGACASSMVRTTVVESTNTNRNSQRKAFIEMPPVFPTIYGLRRYSTPLSLSSAAGSVVDWLGPLIFPSSQRRGGRDNNEIAKPPFLKRTGAKRERDSAKP